jgi:hypothetical protein
LRLRVFVAAEGFNWPAGVRGGFGLPRFAEMPRLLWSVQKRSIGVGIYT